MKWFLDLTTRRKLLVSFGLMIVFLAIVIATAYSGMTAMHESQKSLYLETEAQTTGRAVQGVTVNRDTEVLKETTL